MRCRNEEGAQCGGIRRGTLCEPNDKLKPTWSLHDRSHDVSHARHLDQGEHVISSQAVAGDLVAVDDDTHQRKSSYLLDFYIRRSSHFLQYPCHLLSLLAEN